MNEKIEELLENFLNGNISDTMESLGEMSKFDAMLISLQIYSKLQYHSQRESFIRAIERRSSV